MQNVTFIENGFIEEQDFYMFGKATGYLLQQPYLKLLHSFPPLGTRKLVLLAKK